MNRKRHIMISISLVIALVFFGAALTEASDVPPITVSLSLEKSLYLPDEPIQVTVSLANQGSPVITTDGFQNRKFYLSLWFTDSKGRVIQTNVIPEGGITEPLGSDMLYTEDSAIAVEKVETVESGWTWTMTFRAGDYYTIPSGDSYSVRAVILMRTFSGIDYTFEAVTYSELDAASWWGALVSNIVETTVVSDKDGDGYSAPVALSPPYNTKADCDDRNPNVNPGAIEIPGNGMDDDCNPATTDAVAPGTLLIRAERHIVGNGNYPGTVKEPLAGLPVRIYDRSNSACAGKIGTSWQMYKALWQSCYTADNGIGVTDSSGTLSLNLAPGSYIAIGRLDENTYIGRVIGAFGPAESKHEYIQVIVKADNKTVPAKYTVKTGSQLLIIEPEYTEWNGTQELYPFVFESIGDWSVTTSVTPPEGFVADRDALTAEVNTQLKAVQFVIKDIGSKWVETGVVHTIKHKGKTEKVKSSIGIKCSKKLAKGKGFDEFCRKVKQ